MLGEVDCLKHNMSLLEPTKLMAKNKEKIEKGSILEKEVEFEIIETPDYTDKEKTYLSNLQKRFETAQRLRDANHEQFDGLNFISYWEANERGANTRITPIKNKGDSLFQSGTLRTKLLAFLSTFQGLNLGADISAFTEQEVLVNNLGNSMEIIIDKTEELENDEEKKMLREYEMLKHGYVFVEELWEERWEVKKKLTSGFFGDKKKVKWTTTRKKALGAPKRNILSGLSVYLGSLREYFIKDQPYIYTFEILDRVDAEQLYSHFEMWEHVSKIRKSLSSTTGMGMVENAWRLFSDTKKEQVEVIKYQDKINNEFQIVLNGVPMLPMGFPLTEINGDGEYTIIQQNLEPIQHDFAYGKSFIFKNKNLVAVLDEMMRLGVLKTQKSFLPPYINTSNRIISRNVLMPGKISRGIKKGELVPITDKEAQGVTSSEFGMISELKRFIDEKTVSPTFTGSREKGTRVTATQIMEIQRQAKIMMGLMVLTAGLLHKKLTTKRLMILLEKWFDPIDKELDASRKMLKNRYRRVAVETDIEKEGRGVRMVIPTNNIPNPREIQGLEKSMRKRIGKPIRLVFLNPDQLKQARLTWVVHVNPKEKKSSELSKILFGQMIQDAVNLGLRLNPGFIEKRFAEVWDEDAGKMFSKEPEMPIQNEEGVKRTESPRISPQIKIPGSSLLKSASA